MGSDESVIFSMIMHHVITTVSDEGLSNIGYIKLLGGGGGGWIYASLLKHQCKKKILNLTILSF